MRGEGLFRCPQVVWPWAIVVLIVLAAALLANSMTKDIGRDEQMYCTAGVLLAQGHMIYRDFSYPSQLPYHPLLLAALYRGFGTTQYLLLGRLVSVASDILVVVFILLIYRSVFGSQRRAGLLFGLAAATLFVFNPLVDYAAGYAWNHDVVILCIVVSLWLWMTTDFQRPSRFWRVGVMGALLTFATFMRVTTALVELLFLAAVLAVAGGTLRNRLRTALPFCGAALVLAVWPLWVIAQAPQAFRLNLVHIPTLYGRWLHEQGMTLDKLALTMASFLEPGYLVLLLLAGYLAGIAWRHRSSLNVRERQTAVVTTLLPLVLLGVAYIPPTMWPQYLAMPVSFLAIALACPLVVVYRQTEVTGSKSLCRITAWLVLGVTVVAILAYPVVLQRCLFLAVPERWIPIESHRQSVRIAATVGTPRLALTLGPLHALEGGCDIYAELACGSIVYRVADRLSPEQRRITHTVGPETLAGLVAERPASVVIVGVEPSYFAFLEEPLRKLIPPDWRRDTYDNGLQVYRRP